MRLVTAEEMRNADQAAMNEFGIPGIVLMENAGKAVVDQAEKMLGTLNGKKATIFCGGGNNGGDGLVAARHMVNKGCDVRLYFLNDPEVFRGDALTNYEILSNMGVSGLQLGEAVTPDPGRPALILRRSSGQQLWDIAKSTGSTVESIRNANGLTEAPDDDRMLLIPVI